VNRWLFRGLPWPGESAHDLVVVAVAALPVDKVAAVYVQFGDASDWCMVGVIACGKSSAIFRLARAPDGVVVFGVGISLQDPALALPMASSPAQVQVQAMAPTAVADMSRRLLQSFTDYALSFAQSIHGAPCVPARVISDWFDKTMHKARIDPEGFVVRLLNQQ